PWNSPPRPRLRRNSFRAAAWDSQERNRIEFEERFAELWLALFATHQETIRAATLRQLSGFSSKSPGWIHAFTLSALRSLCHPCRGSLVIFDRCSHRFRGGLRCCVPPGLSGRRFSHRAVD